MADYKIEVDGRIYEVAAENDQQAEQMGAWIQSRIAEGDPDLKDTSAAPERFTLTDRTKGQQPAQQATEPAQPAQDDSALSGFLAGAVKPVDNLAEWLGNTPLGTATDAIGGALGMPTTDEAVASNEQWRAGNTRSGWQLAGNIAGTLPLMNLPGGAFTQGAAGGAVLSDADSLGGIAADAAIGGVGGKLADTALRGIARVAAPQVSQGLRTLIDAGVKVTPGQTGRAMGGRLGRAIGRAEDRATSAPWLGDNIVDARNESLDSFARSTVNRALEPIGAALPGDVPVGRSAVKWAGDKLSAGYKEIEPSINVTGDEDFLDDLAEIQLATPDMLPERVAQFNSILQGLGRFWEGGTTLTGRAYKDIETRLTTNINRYAKSQDADQQQLGSMLESVRDALQDLAVRQNPAVGERLSQLNQGWKALTQVERASGNSKAAVTPSGYSQAVKQSSDTVRRRGYARGEAMNQDLADAASDILPSEVADSGTGGRLSQQSLTALGLGALQAPLYMAAQKAAPVLTRDNYLSPGMARLLRQGAPYATIGSAATAHALVPVGQ